jgi:multiple sugar transport system permease protein
MIYYGTTLLPHRNCIWGDTLAFATMTTLPVLVLFLAFQRWFIRGIATTGIKG